ncbi:unnamed protein product [Didymodactylos carnosus]|uniref:Uncharacterized protein n=1 Tax=Didymodactylos carnosus TaxID=1234261 RepID=A0A813RXV5_9BILA|nr:unnamed protein product [Didymodactylos carnosus]CAF3572439.1 unnamed protein product [Didymodactylos carnosus]
MTLNNDLRRSSSNRKSLVARKKEQWLRDKNQYPENNSLTWTGYFGRSAQLKDLPKSQQQQVLTHDSNANFNNNNNNFHHYYRSKLPTNANCSLSNNMLDPKTLANMRKRTDIHPLDNEFNNCGLRGVLTTGTNKMYDFSSLGLRRQKQDQLRMELQRQIDEKARNYMLNNSMIRKPKIIHTTDNDESKSRSKIVNNAHSDNTNHNAKLPTGMQYRSQNHYDSHPSTLDKRNPVEYEYASVLQKPYLCSSETNEQENSYHISNQQHPPVLDKYPTRSVSHDKQEGRLKPPLQQNCESLVTYPRDEHYPETNLIPITSQHLQVPQKPHCVPSNNERSSPRLTSVQGQSAAIIDINKPFTTLFHQTYDPMAHIRLKMRQREARTWLAYEKIKEAQDMAVRDKKEKNAAKISLAESNPNVHHVAADVLPQHQPLYEQNSSFLQSPSNGNQTETIKPTKISATADPTQTVQISQEEPTDQEQPIAPKRTVVDNGGSNSQRQSQMRNTSFNNQNLNQVHQQTSDNSRRDGFRDSLSNDQQQSETDVKVKCRTIEKQTSSIQFVDFSSQKTSLHYCRNMFDMETQTDNSLSEHNSFGKRVKDNKLCIQKLTNKFSIIEKETAKQKPMLLRKRPAISGKWFAALDEKNGQSVKSKTKRRHTKFDVTPKTSRSVSAGSTDTTERNTKNFSKNIVRSQTFSNPLNTSDEKKKNKINTVVKQQQKRHHYTLPLIVTSTPTSAKENVCKNLNRLETTEKEQYNLPHNSVSDNKLKQPGSVTFRTHLKQSHSDMCCYSLLSIQKQKQQMSYESTFKETHQKPLPSSFSSINSDRCLFNEIQTVDNSISTDINDTIEDNIITSSLPSSSPSKMINSSCSITSHMYSSPHDD